MHGGDIYSNDIELDFSVNINPLGVPADVKEAIIKSIELSDRYPDIKAYELKKKLAGHFMTDITSIAVGNGASELLMALMHAIKPQKVLLTAPSFTGYEHAANAIKAECVYYEMSAKAGFSITEDILDMVTEDIDMLILTNPNNPTGRLIVPELLEAIIRKAEETKIITVLDECFIALSSSKENSLAYRIAEYKSLVVLRAFTKSFAIPAIRLGYAISDKANIDLIEEQLPEWNVSIQAQMAGIAALENTAYLKDAAELIKEEKEYLETNLKRLGFEITRSDTCFMLIWHKRKNDIYKKLLENKILIRNCSDYRGLDDSYLRIAIKKHAENERLICALDKILDK